MTPPTLNLTRLGWGLALSVVFLATLGIATIHATDRTVAREREVAERLTTESAAPAEIDWPERITRAVGELTLRQSLYFLSGIGLLFLVLRPSYRRIGEFAYPIYWVNIALLAALLVDRYLVDLPLIRPGRNDVWRWIYLGPLSLQPSEFMKLSLILALARYLRFRDSYRRWWGLLPPFLLTLLPMALILKEPDLGTVLMLLPVLFVMLFVAGARIRHLALVVMLGLASLPAFYLYGMKDYQRQRVMVLWKQNTPDEQWHMGPGYQLRQGLTALGTGGLWGEGFGGSTFIRRGLLPEEHNDFIFALHGNQWGFAGCMLVILAYVVIVVLGLEVALVTNDPFGRLLAVGVVAMIVAQALLNICMNIGLAPITGMTLPFVSFGGSSLWANFIALGLLVNVAQRRPMLLTRPPFEFDEDE